MTNYVNGMELGEVQRLSVQSKAAAKRLSVVRSLTLTSCEIYLYC